MNRLNSLDDALRALAACLDASGHGPACVCGLCAAHEQATRLLPRLDHLLQVLTAWSTAEWAEGDGREAEITPEDLRLALRMLD
jgi:hypothetical protein